MASAATLLIRLCTLWFGVAVGLVALPALSRLKRDAAFPPKLAPSLCRENP